jgi:hypothetical protein
MRRMLAIAIVLSVWAAPGVADAGNFQVICRFSHALPDDPIVFPGSPGASHLHTFVGNTSTDAHSTYQEMVTASTTCSESSDTAGYWVPAVLVDAEVVDPIKVNAYYAHGQGIAPASVVATPADLRVLAGGDTTSTARPRSASWSCQGGKPGALPRDCSNGKLVRAHVKFPNCWNGTNLDSTNHRSHLAYSTKASGCPASHPVPIPALTIVIVYPLSNGSAITLSSGSPTTMHGDFWNTWDQSSLVAFTIECVRTSGSCGILRD